MTWRFVEEARKRWRRKQATSYELSYEGNVSQSTMWQALTEKTWGKR